MSLLPKLQVNISFEWRARSMTSDSEDEVSTHARQVLVVDDGSVGCRGLVTVLSASRFLSITHIEHKGSAVIDSVRGCTPAGVVLPLRGEGVLGLIQRVLGVSGGSTRVIVVGEHGPLMERSLVSGASGGITWSCAAHEVPSLVMVALEREHRNGRRRPAEDAPWLSIRERQVLELAARGLTNSSAARALSLSESTVKTYWRRIFRKLDVHDRTNAVASAMAKGILAVPVSDSHSVLQVPETLS